jgi:hypothetical protein
MNIITLTRARVDILIFAAIIAMLLLMGMIYWVFGWWGILSLLCINLAGIIICNQRRRPCSTCTGS